MCIFKVMFVGRVAVVQLSFLEQLSSCRMLQLANCFNDRWLLLRTAFRLWRNFRVRIGRSSYHRNLHPGRRLLRMGFLRWRWMWRWARRGRGQPVKWYGALHDFREWRCDMWIEPDPIESISWPSSEHVWQHFWTCMLYIYIYIYIYIYVCYIMLYIYIYIYIYMLAICRVIKNIF